MRAAFKGRAALLALICLGAACDSHADPEPIRGAGPTPVAAAPVAAPLAAGPSKSAARARPPGRLPEDPVAGKRSQLQWDEHLARENRERQRAFDYKRLKEHRAVVAMLTAARARYDRAKTEAALTKARESMPTQLAKVRERVAQTELWGSQSALVPDYEALQAALTESYANAKLAAIQGNPSALQGARASFDQHMHTIAEWLEEAEESKGRMEEMRDADERHQEGERQPDELHAEEDKR